MRFSGPHWPRTKTPEEKKIEELEAENNRLFLEQGLDKWHIEEEEKERENIEEAHGIDHLTGVHTRKFFDAKLEQEFTILNKEEHREGVKPLTEVSLIFIDLDNFKKVNDTLGHAHGDDVLKRAAELLHGALREEDLLARYGGDEFVVLLPNAEEKDAALVAEKLRAALDDDASLKNLGVTGSFGVASSGRAESAEALRAYADKALYVAKAGGRNRVEIYTGA
ncbi:MAG: GGDEF domain-containing protein [Minisyncoccota bacterium]